MNLHIRHKSNTYISTIHNTSPEYAVEPEPNMQILHENKMII